MVSSYDYRLVALSVFIAVLASYAALDVAGRVTSARGGIRFVWLSGGAVAMGIGIWSMHYVGMLAFQVPVPVQYDWPTALVSLLAAIFASAIALFVVSREKMGSLSSRIQSQHVVQLGVLLKKERRRIVLDLKEIILVDREAVRFLAACETKGSELKNCPAFVREWILRERRSRSESR